MNRERRRLTVTALVGVAAVVLSAVVVDRLDSPPVVAGPFARLLAESADLGPASQPVQLTVALHRPAEPVLLSDWAHSRGLSVRWRDGDPWAIVEGPGRAVAEAFEVAVNDYRTRSGEVFYASPQQPDIPAPARAEVSGLGRILSRTPYREGLPPTPPRDVPDGGLLPNQLWNAYNMTALIDAGFTGKGTTVVVFSFDGFDQADLDNFADWFKLPRFTPEVIGGMAEHRTGESTMDLQMIHAMAPDAKLVMVNARPTVEGGGSAFEKLGRLMESVDRKFPGAIWSFSIGWGCDRLITAADLVPVRSALAGAHKRGTTAFDASGDLAGLECRGGKHWSDPPSPDDVGVDAVASVPEMTAVGGTTLSTDAQGGWLAEQAWYDVPLTQGTAGGASSLFGRPSWQEIGTSGLPDRRLVPDISAVADPFTGVKFVFRGQVVTGGGTSQAAPVWAGVAAVVNQLLKSDGLAPLGDLNPLLYQVAKGAVVPGFRDIELGGNAISPGGTGYDMVTGLGSPNVENLVKNIQLHRTVGR